MTPPYEWLERRLFEVLGGWVPTTPEPEVKLMLRRHSFLHASHAELWAVHGVQATQAGAGAGPMPSEGLVRLVEAVAAPTGTAARLAGAYGVLLPALIASYRARSTPVPPTVVADEEAAMAEGMAWRDGWDGDEAARRHQTAVDRLRAESGL